MFNNRFYLPIPLTLLLTFVITLSTTLAAPLPTLPGSSYYPWQSVHWTSAPSTIPSDTTINLSWKGGSGEGFEVYYIPQWIGQESYKPVDIAKTSSRSLKWHTPKIDDYPSGTTFIVAVNDVVGRKGSNWYDITGMLDFVDK